MSKALYVGTWMDRRESWLGCFKILSIKQGIEKNQQFSQMELNFVDSYWGCVVETNDGFFLVMAQTIWMYCVSKLKREMFFLTMVIQVCMPNWLCMPGGHLWVGHITVISRISLEQYLLDIRLQGDCHWHVIGHEMRSCLNYLIYPPGNKFISPTVWHYWKWCSFFWKVGYMLVSLDICWIYISLDLTKAQKHNIFSQTLHIAGKFIYISHVVHCYPDILGWTMFC